VMLMALVLESVSQMFQPETIETVVFTGVVAIVTKDAIAIFFTTAGFAGSLLLLAFGE